MKYACGEVHEQMKQRFRYMLLCCAELEPDSSDQFWTLAFFNWDFLSLWKQEFEDAA